MSKKIGGFIIFALLGLLGMSLLPALAAPAPSVKVTPVWRPASQLTTIDTNADGVTDPGDDIRYVVADIYATTNVEFWAVGFTCTVNKAVLESYVQNGDPNSTEDNVAMFTNGVNWISATNNVQNTTDTDGKINFAISELGTNALPMGSNGVSLTLHIASLKYRVKEGLIAAGTSPFTCTTNFLNRDGKPVLAAVYVAPPALSIIPGYTFTGKATYQGTTTVLTAAQAIDIVCDDSDADTTFDDVVTKANITTGLFSVNNLRTQGRYECQFIGNIHSPLDPPTQHLHLMSTTDFNLTTGSFALLPMMLKSGNVYTIDSGSQTAVDSFDLVTVTSNWTPPLTTLTLPYMYGDASGDRKINEADLALVGGNYYRSEPTPAQHLIYSLPRDVNAFQDSHLWLGENNSASVTPFVAGTTRDYWPAVSPNGAKIAFVRNVGVGTADKFALFSAPIVNGVVGIATRLTPAAAAYDAFAPAWSPDGSQLAFVCSYNLAWKDLTTPTGNLCLIDSGGLNFRLPLNANGGAPIPTKIQTPAWAGAQYIYVAYPLDPANPTFSQSLCILNIPSYTLSHPGAIPSGSDMPVVRDGGALGLNLLYRFDNGAGSRNIRFAQLSAVNALPLSFYGNTIPPIHEDAAGISSTAVDYFTVSTGADPDIFFYVSDPATNLPGGNVLSVRPFNGNFSNPQWTTLLSVNYTLSSSVGNPAFNSGYNAALRNTAAFVP